MSRRILSCIAVGAMILAGCGSNTTSTADQPRTTTATDDVGDLPAIDPTVMPELTSDFVRAAVVDESHVLVLDFTDTMVKAAALADRNGDLHHVEGPIPRMGKASVVGTSSGFVIVGIRCPDSKPFTTKFAEDEQLCSPDSDGERMVEAQVIAVALDTTGKAEWTATGPWINPARFGGATPTADGALTWIDGRYYTVRGGRFEPVVPPPGDHDLFVPCVLRDGQLVAFVGTLNSQQDDALGGQRRLMVRTDGGWSAHGPAREVPEGDLVGGSCTVGGLVSKTEVFTGGPAVDANRADVSLESIAGITADGRLLMDHNPRRLVDPASGDLVETFADSKGVALSWDGRTIAQITESGIQSRTAQ